MTMNDLPDSFEERLRQCRPAAPSPALARAIDSALAAPTPPPAGLPRRVRTMLWASWSATAVAAGLAMAAWLRGPPAAGAGETPPAELRTADTVAGSAAAGDDRLIPVGSTNTFYGLRDEGVVYLDGRTPARKVRLQYLDTLRLQDAAEATSVAVRYPREEVRLIPIRTY